MLSFCDEGLGFKLQRQMIFTLKSRLELFNFLQCEIRIPIHNADVDSDGRALDYILVANAAREAPQSVRRVPPRVLTGDVEFDPVAVALHNGDVAGEEQLLALRPDGRARLRQGQRSSLADRPVVVS